MKTILIRIKNSLRKIKKYRRTHMRKKLNNKVKNMKNLRKIRSQKNLKKRISQKKRTKLAKKN
jgi:hypothetical protein